MKFILFLESSNRSYQLTSKPWSGSGIYVTYLTGYITMPFRHQLIFSLHNCRSYEVIVVAMTS